MKLQGGFAEISFVVLLFFSTMLVAAVSGEAVQLEFEVLASGDISGYIEETYLIARNEEEFEEIWKNHSTPRICPEHWIEFWENRTSAIPSMTEPPEINFSQAMVVCAFMGERRTAGYNITIEGIWVEEAAIHVELVKSKPTEDWAAAQVLTYPYVFASLERREMDVIFVITEDGSQVSYILPEISSKISVLVLFATLSGMIIVYTKQTLKHLLKH